VVVVVAEAKVEPVAQRWAENTAVEAEEVAVNWAA
jgi:hypothetical protein